MPPPAEAQVEVAKIGASTVTVGELNAGIEDKLVQLRRQHETETVRLNLSASRAREEFLQGALGKLLDSRVLMLEARARNSTPDALLKAIKTPDVSDAQMHALYDSQKLQIGQPYENVASQLKEFMQHDAAEHAKRAYLDGLRSKYKVTIVREPMREQVQAVGPQRGPDSAAVTIVEFSDFQCPFCGRFTPVLQQALKAYPTQVKLVFRNLPLTSLHPAAAKAAEAGVCAKNQGKFWEMHDMLFAEQNALGIDALKAKAQRIGLNTSQFDDCLDGSKAADAVKADMEAASELGLGATPSSFVNGRFVNGALSIDELTALIKDELRRVSPAASR